MKSKQDQIDEGILEYLSDLVKIDLTEEEKNYFSTQIPEIINYMGILSSVKTDNIPPLYNSTSNKLIEHEDTPNTGLRNEEALHTASKKEGRFFLTPKVL